MRFNKGQGRNSENETMTSSSSDSKRFKSTGPPFSASDSARGLNGANGSANFERAGNDFCPTSKTCGSTLPGAYKSKRRNGSTVASYGSQQINIAPNLL